MSAHPQMGTGYARMANEITNYLANLPGVEVVCYAFDYVETMVIKDRFIDPRIKFYDCMKLSRGTDPSAINYTTSILMKEKPDILFIYNNTVMTKRIIEAIPSQYLPPIKYLYLDIIYEWQDSDTYDYIKKCNFDQIFTFSDHWKNHLIGDIGFSETCVSTLTQAIDPKRFRCIPQYAAKLNIGLKPDDFLILNLNRNAWRKGWNVTISAFLEFLKRQEMNPQIKLFCGCSMSSQHGYNIINVIYNECKRLNIDAQKVLDRHVIILSNPMADDDVHINNMYNASDIGINTCFGEGFGLTILEHLMFNRPQIVSGIPNLKEIFGSYASYVEPSAFSYGTPYEMTGGQCAHIDYIKVADCIEFHYKNRDILPNPSEEFKNKYSIENVFKVLDKYFKR